MSRASVVQPPRIAVWLIELFASDAQIEPVQGDLLEDFSLIASRSGIPAARRWYWKQSLKTSLQLFRSGFRSAPGLIAVTTIGAYFFLWATQWLPARLVIDVFDHYPGFFDAHFYCWLLCLHYGGPIVSWIVAILLGCLIGVVANGKEIVATATFGVFRIVVAPIFTIALFGAYMALLPHNYRNSNLGYIGVVVMRGVNFAEAYRQGYGRMGFLFLYFIQPFASVLLPILGGVIVRRFRLTAAHRPLGA